MPDGANTPSEYRSPWLDDELESFRGTVRRFVTDVLAPREPAWQQAHRVDAASWREMGSMGLLLVRRARGIRRQRRHVRARLHRLRGNGVRGRGELRQIACTTSARITSNATARKTRSGAGCRGSRAASSSARSRCPNPPPGSDLQGIRTRAVRNGEHYVVNGSKTFITNGQVANLIMLVAKTDTAAGGAKGISLVMVETDGLDGLPPRPHAGQDRHAGAGHLRALLRRLPRSGGRAAWRRRRSRASRR